MGSIIRSPSFLFLDDFNRNANISVAIKSGSTVLQCLENNQTYMFTDSHTGISSAVIGHMRL